jgi:hypothetical protein
LALSCAACQTSEEPKLSVEVPVVVPRAAPGELKAQCPRQPARPATFATINSMLSWVEKALYAGSACRTLSDKQGEWIATPPT